MKYEYQSYSNSITIFFYLKDILAKLGAMKKLEQYGHRFELGKQPLILPLRYAIYI